MIDISISKVKLLFPGILIAVIVAFAANFLGEHYGAPTMLFALLLGMAVNFLGDDPKIRVGIDFAARTILRIGVALLGLRIAFSDVVELGWQPVMLLVLGVVSTIAVGIIVARLLGGNARFGTLTGGAVAICGASAALALSAIMPRDETLERNTVFTVVSVTTLSTLAMIIYPIIAQALSLNDAQAGLFFGATIHDVAQVVGAGFSVSDEAGNIATLTKLMRVALLVPVVLVVSIAFRSKATKGGRKRPFLPLFLIMFMTSVAVNSAGFVPDSIADSLIDLSRMCLITAITAVGIKTQLKSVMEVGILPVVLMLVETLWLAGLVLLCLPYVV